MNQIETDIAKTRQSGLTKIAADLDFVGQSVLITGAAAGIGAAVVSMLHQFGAHIIALDIQADALQDLSARFDGKRITTLPFDLSQTDPAAYDALARAIIKGAPNSQIDAFIMSAGVVQLTKGRGLRGTPAWEFQKLNQINALSNADIFRALGNHGSNHLADDIRIVMTSSPIVGRADVTTPGYAMSKALMEDVTNQMIADLAGTNAIVTGYVPPPVQNFLRADLKPNEPMHAHPHGADIAELPARLASRTIKPSFDGAVMAMGYDHLRRKDGLTPSGKAFDYMPRNSNTNGFVYELRTRLIAAGGGDLGTPLQMWDTDSSRALQGLGKTPDMDAGVSLKDVYKAPDHIAQHRKP